MRILVPDSQRSGSVAQGPGAGFRPPVSIVESSMNRRDWLCGAAMLVGAALISAPFAAQSADQAQMATMRFDLAMSIGAEGDAEGQFKYVEDFAFDANGRLYATDAAHAWVQVFDKASGRFK